MKYKIPKKRKGQTNEEYARDIYQANKATMDNLFADQLPSYMNVEDLIVDDLTEKLDDTSNIKKILHSGAYTSKSERAEENILHAIRSDKELRDEFRYQTGWKQKLDAQQMKWIGYENIANDDGSTSNYAVYQYFSPTGVLLATVKICKSKTDMIIEYANPKPQREKKEQPPKSTPTPAPKPEMPKAPNMPTPRQARRNARRGLNNNGAHHLYVR